MADEIGVREFKNGASSFIQRVEEGEVITVTRHGKPVARLIPAGVPAGIAELIASGRVRWSGGKPEPPKRPTLTGKGMTLADYVIEGRR